MTAAGATSDTNITVAGMSYDYDIAQGKGVRVGRDVMLTLNPGENNPFTVDVEASQAVIVTFY
jgi:Glycosyl hydrolase family 79 C-terminal beta domain